MRKPACLSVLASLTFLQVWAEAVGELNAADVLALSSFAAFCSLSVALSSPLVSFAAFLAFTSLTLTRRFEGCGVRYARALPFVLLLLPLFLRDSARVVRITTLVSNLHVP